MTGIDTHDAAALGARLAELLQTSDVEEACDLIAPILSSRIRFPLLERIGRPLADCPKTALYSLLDRIIALKTIGGPVIIGAALGGLIHRNLPAAFDRCRRYIATAGVWHATDDLGERVPGPALVQSFQEALPLLEPWRADTDRWVRRGAGVAVHFWAKRTRGRTDLMKQAGLMLDFLAPLLEEQEQDAVKGIGWGLKTLGRFYPDLVTAWLVQKLREGRRPRALMLRKALTYLSPAQRARVTGGTV